VEALAFPPAKTDQEGERSRRGGEAGRLSVETDKRRGRRCLSRESGKAMAIERDGHGPRLDPEECAVRPSDHLAIDRRREPFGELGGLAGRLDCESTVARPGRGPGDRVSEIGEPSLERNCID
jgi:hypothetical protein